MPPISLLIRAGLRGLPMRELIRRRLHGDESGVTMIIVALCMVALIGMIVLVVDVGGLLWNRRAMVNASDAAALSAAKSCVLPASMDPQTAEQAADALAAQNSTGADVARTTSCRVGMRHRGYGLRDRAVRREPAALLRRDLRRGTGARHHTGDGDLGTRRRGEPDADRDLPEFVPELPVRPTSTPTRRVTSGRTTTTSTDPRARSACSTSAPTTRASTGGTRTPASTCSTRAARSTSGSPTTPITSVGDLPLNYPNPTYVCRASGNRQRRGPTSLTWRARRSCSRSTGATMSCPGTWAGSCSIQVDVRGGLLADARPVRHHRVLRREADQRLQAQRGRRRHGAAVRRPGRSRDPTTHSLCTRGSRHRSRARAPSSAPDQISNVVIDKVEEERSRTRTGPRNATTSSTTRILRDPVVTWIASGPAQSRTRTTKCRSIGRQRASAGSRPRATTPATA